jgi:hypothetical protein
MTQRAQLVLNTRDARETAHRWVNGLPAGTRVEFKGPQRSIDQNDRMWAMLTDISRQHKHAERRFTTNEWKVLFLHACGRETQFLPALSGNGFVPYGQSSSDLSVAEMTELLEFMFAWGAENGIVWSDPTQPAELAGEMA